MAAILFFMRRRRPLACALMSNTTSHDNQKKFSSWVSFLSYVGMVLNRSSAFKIMSFANIFLFFESVMIQVVPLNKRKTAEYWNHTLPRRTEQSVSDGEGRLPRNLENNDITKLLDDLDNQTEAIKSGQQIGDELLGDKIHTGGISFTNIITTRALLFQASGFL